MIEKTIHNRKEEETETETESETLEMKVKETRKKLSRRKRHEKRKGNKKEKKRETVKLFAINHKGMRIEIKNDLLLHEYIEYCLRNSSLHNYKIVLRLFCTINQAEEDDLVDNHGDNIEDSYEINFTDEKPKRPLISKLIKEETNFIVYIQDNNSHIEEALIMPFILNKASSFMIIPPFNYPQLLWYLDNVIKCPKPFTIYAIIDRNDKTKRIIPIGNNRNLLKILEYTIHKGDQDEDGDYCLDLFIECQ